MRTQLREIKQLLERNLKGKIKTFFLGRPSAIPLSSLPALYVEAGNDEMEIRDSQYDTHTSQIVVGVAIKKEFSSKANFEKAERYDIMDIFEGKDTTGDIQYASVVGVMRKRNQADNITGGISLEMNPANINYNEPVANLDDEQVMVREGNFTLTYQDDVINTNDAPTSSTTTSAVLSVVAGTGIPSATIELNTKYIYVAGSGGAVDITANPQIAYPISTNTTRELVIVGTSDTNTVKFEDSNGLALDGGQPITLGANDNLYLFWNTQSLIWCELARSNN